mmetsp:Transcript_11082/g.33684  ORF Transcript_11082/g.33684 Transcript_11082/m.33684 type:complete len:385 (+) Transcript_11082:709-1863(+)
MELDLVRHVPLAMARLLVLEVPLVEHGMQLLLPGPEVRLVRRDPLVAPERDGGEAVADGVGEGVRRLVPLALEEVADALPDGEVRLPPVLHRREHLDVLEEAEVDGVVHRHAPLLLGVPGGAHDVEADPAEHEGIHHFADPDEQLLQLREADAAALIEVALLEEPRDGRELVLGEVEEELRRHVHRVILGPHPRRRSRLLVAVEVLPRRRVLELLPVLGQGHVDAHLVGEPRLRPPAVLVLEAYLELVIRPVGQICDLRGVADLDLRGALVDPLLSLAALVAAPALYEHEGHGRVDVLRQVPPDLRLPLHAVGAHPERLLRQRDGHQPRVYAAAIAREPLQRGYPCVKGVHGAGGDAPEGHRRPPLLTPSPTSVPSSAWHSRNL